MKPVWSRYKDCEKIEEMTVPKVNWTEKEQWTHSKRAGETAVNAEQIRTLKETRERYTRCFKGKPDTPEENTRRLRRIRIGQKKAFG